MKYRTLGSSDLKVSEISLGSWLTYSGGVAFERARECTNAAFDAGINFFDTANVYGRGAAETAWGEICRAVRATHTCSRPRCMTRCRTIPPTADCRRRRSPSRSTRRSARLQTDYVDLYQAHRFDPDVAIEETIEALQQVVLSGKARYLGFSEWNPEQIQAAIDIAGPDLFVSSQPQYSMLWQAPEAEIFPLCEVNGISQIVWSPLAQGLLTGKYRPGQAPPPDSRRGSSEMGGPWPSS